LIEGYGLVRAIIPEDSSFIDKTLVKCELSVKGLLVLGIERGRNWIPIPKETETIRAGALVIG
jgi:uncharacterized protein with PhoU and TrkA domain